MNSGSSAIGKHQRFAMASPNPGIAETVIATSSPSYSLTKRDPGDERCQSISTSAEKILLKAIQHHRQIGFRAAHSQRPKPLKQKTCLLQKSK
ncbi:hypothetical protein [Limnofasciculus baicalensis]|uniref:Uncharacterized protein n=1 Tax=Limnofasciculus baicalensis BBK-W-15 TaxID=2699891 RepID=A0AAE3KUI5_9CYAN|nr:hypothetical protein [Limnofasciculus baicalensis]MCP2731552.1 hypothetical protein [Limnofasciculus baicalensis BBK-W-15]